MEINIIKQDKNHLEIELDNLTIAEFLRNELWGDSATELAAWKRTHPSKNPILVLRTKGKTAKAVFNATLTKLKKNNQEILTKFKAVFK